MSHDPQEAPSLFSYAEGEPCWTVIAPTGAVWHVQSVEDVARLAAALLPMTCPVEGRPIAAFHPLQFVPH